VTAPLGRVGVRLALPVALVVLWWVLSADSDSPYWPPLSEILTAFRELWFFEHFSSDLLPSVWHLAAGFAIAAVVGIALGVALGLSPRARRNVAPLTEFSRSMPIAALVPISLIIFGPGAQMEIALIAFGCCWPILVSTADGVRSVEPTMLETARVYGLNRRQQMLRVTLPGALPQAFAGLRVALAIGVATMIISNMFGSGKGLGFFVINAQQTYHVRDMWAGIILIGLIGALASAILVAIEWRALRWHRGWRAAATERR
jgi:ABC-type nitrate/sulfonate/bicarbonate transport system permease component